MIDPNELAKLITAFNQAEQGAPGHLESYLLDNAEEISEKLKELDGAIERAKTLERGIGEFQDIMDDSEGIAGWNANGDVAPWTEFFDGLSLEEWILEHGEEKENSEKAGAAGEESEDEMTDDSTVDDNDA